ncbi:MAG TPA: hypothetical protein VFJ30_18955 [Phycisphaerae bacterium]|nr:hypothetical protein [Phycisphaerae bacterium]
MRKPGAQLVPHALLLCAAVLCGCPADSAVVGQRSPAAVPLLPTARRPIVPGRGDPSVLLLFGGDSGLGRFALGRPEGLIAYGIRPDGRLAAVMTDDGAVRFYDVFGETIGRVPLPRYTPVPPDQQQFARLFVGAGGQAIVSLGRHRRLPVMDVPPPVLPAVPVQWMTWHVTTAGEARCLEHEAVLSAAFPEKGGFALVGGPDTAAPLVPEDRWRLTWYDRAGGPAWQATFPDRPWFAPDGSGDGICVRLPGHWPLRFHPDGTWAVHPPDVEALREQNPGYVKRAGAFYEKEYLPPAVADLSRAAGVKGSQRAAATEALRQFIHDWLTACVEDGFLILPEHQDRCLKDLDGRMQQVLSATGFESYLRWRRESKHALRFLMVARADPRVAPALTLRRFR